MAAQDAWDKGAFRPAALAWEGAYALVANGATAYNAGRAWERAGDRARAADAFTAAMSGELVPAARDDITARLTALEPALGIIEITANAEDRVTVDAEASQLSPLRRHVLPGSHEVRARGANGEFVTRVDVSAGTLIAVDATVRAPPPRPVVPPPPPEPPSTTTKTLGWVALGTAGAVLIGGVVVGAVGSSANDRFNDSGHFDDSARSQAVTFRTTANVAFIAGGVFAVTGLVLLLTSPSSSTASTASSQNVSVFRGMPLLMTP